MNNRHGFWYDVSFHFPFSDGDHVAHLRKRMVLPDIGYKWGLKKLVGFCFA